MKMRISAPETLIKRCLDFLEESQSLWDLWSSFLDSLWETIQTNGIDKEFQVDREDLSFLSLPLTVEQRQGLKNFDEETIGFFNIFDIVLKEKFVLQFIDLIDRDKGVVFIIKLS